MDDQDARSVFDQSFPPGRTVYVAFAERVPRLRHSSGELASASRHVTTPKGQVNSSIHDWRLGGALLGFSRESFGAGRHRDIVWGSEEAKDRCNAYVICPRPSRTCT